MVQAIYSFTMGGPWNRGLATNTTNASFDAWATETSIPVSSATEIVIPTEINNGKIANMVEIMPFGIGAAETFSIRVSAWNPSATADQYVGRPIVVLATQLGLITGSGTLSLLKAADLIADTLTLTSGDTQAKIISPVDDTAASCLFDPTGSPLIRVEFAMNAGATSGNILWRMVS